MTLASRGGRLGARRPTGDGRTSKGRSATRAPIPAITVLHSVARTATRARRWTARRRPWLGAAGPL